MFRRLLYFEGIFVFQGEMGFVRGQVGEVESILLWRVLYIILKNLDFNLQVLRSYENNFYYSKIFLVEIEKMDQEVEVRSLISWLF